MLKYFNNFLLLLFLFLYSCSPEPIDLEIENRFGRLPDTPLYPQDNPYTSQKVELGKMLFWDPILSGDKDVACVTCHHPKNGYAENLDLSIGVGGEGLSVSRQNGTLVKRNAHTLLNAGFNGIDVFGIYNAELAPMLWDKRVESLEEQAILPLLSEEEMRGTEISEEAIIDTIIQRLYSIPYYKASFEEVFGINNITEKSIGKAIATFERTLTSNQSRFDQYVDGDENAFSTLELRGMMNFIDVGCVNCHNGPMFSDFKLHILSVPENDKLNVPDDGDGDFAFRTPTLRNLGMTAPYMHNGVFQTLEEVMEFYEDHSLGEGNINPNVSDMELDKELSKLQLGDQEIASILAFLNTLNDTNFDIDIPSEVPSGLNPGGNIE